MGYSVRTATHRYTEWQDPKDDGRVVARELYQYDESNLENENVSGKVGFSKTEESLQKILTNRK